MVDKTFITGEQANHVWVCFLRGAFKRPPEWGTLGGCQYWREGGKCSFKKSCTGNCDAQEYKPVGEE